MELRRKLVARRWSDDHPCPVSDGGVEFKADEATAALLREHLFPGLTRLLDELPSVPPPALDPEVYACAHGFFCRIARTSQAALHLIDLGLSDESAPLRRALMEHVLQLAWVIEDGAPAVRAHVRARQARMNSIRALLDDRWSIPSEVFDRLLAFDVPSEGQDHMVHFGQLVKRYGTQLSNDLLAAWLTDTGSSHPSHSTYSAYWDATSGLVTSVPARERNDVHAVGFLWWLGACQMDQVMRWGDRLNEIGKQVGLPVVYLRCEEAP